MYQKTAQIIIFVLIQGFFNTGVAQQFSLHHPNLAMHKNPAFSTSYESPFLYLSHINILPHVHFGLKEYFLSGTFPLKEVAGAVGVNFQAMQYGSNSMQQQTFQFFYSHRIRLSSNQYLQAALQGGVLNYAARYSQMEFEEPENIADYNKIYPDFTFGALWNLNNFNLGASVLHLIEPKKEDFAESNIAKRLFMMQSNYKVDVKGISRANNVLICILESGWQDKYAYFIRYGLIYELDKLSMGFFAGHSSHIIPQDFYGSLGYKFSNFGLFYNLSLFSLKNTPGFSKSFSHQVTFSIDFQYKGSRKNKF